MSSGDIRRVSVQDIQLVQNLIERCLQLYMSPSEVVSTLLHQAKIEPGFTELVWQKLEAENQDFFKAYYLRLVVKDQILQFNQLLEKQVELMQPLCPTEPAASITLPNGSQIQQMYQASLPTGSSIKPENINQAVSTIPIVYANGTSTLQPYMQSSVNVMGHAGRNAASANALLAQSSYATLMQGMNGRIPKAEAGYGGNHPFLFGAENGEGAVPPCDGVESSSQGLNETILDQEMKTFGFLGQIPRNFSLSDLTADFSSSTDILENYSRSPFMGTDTNFMDHRIPEEQDLRRLDTISEGLSYEDFGSQ